MRHLILTASLLSSAFGFAANLQECEVSLETSIAWLNSREGVRTSLGSIKENPLTLENALTIEWLDVSSGPQGLKDEELKFLCPLTSVENLMLFQDNKPNQLTGKNLDELRFMSKLQELDLDGNQIDPANLCHLEANTKLDNLRLYDNPLAKNPEGLVCLSRLKNLSVILLQGSRNYKLDAASAIALKSLASIETLETVIFTGNSITDKGFSEGICHLTQLKTLDISANQLSGEGFSCLKNFTNLESLQIGASPMHADETNKITGASLAALLEIPNLKKLYLGGLKFDSIDALIKLKEKGVKIYGLVSSDDLSSFLQRDEL